MHFAAESQQQWEKVNSNIGRNTEEESCQSNGTDGALLYISHVDIFNPSQVLRTVFRRPRFYYMKTGRKQE